MDSAKQPHFLELKVIPVVQEIIALTLMYFLAKITPSLFIAIAFNLKIMVGLLFIGFIIGVVSVYQFKRITTTVNPTTPEKASILVDGGIFSFSRNPMYLALLIALLAAFFYLQNLSGLVVIFAFVYYMTRFQIMPEERALEKVFGKKYLAYQKRVRRWL